MHQGGLYTLKLSKRAIEWAGFEVLLTVAEVKFLQAVMRDANQMIPIEQLQHSMGRTRIATGSAVKKTMYRLRRKLRERDPDFNAIVWYEGGYLFEA